MSLKYDDIAGKITVAAEADVLVAGAGIAGIAAALAAARHGKKVILLDKAFAAGPEHVARNNRYLMLFYQLCSKFFAGKSCLAYIREHIEGAFRFCARKPHIDESFVHKVAALLVRNPHAFNLGSTVLQAFYCAVL